MYGPWARQPSNNDYRRQYASYQYGGGDRGSNNANQIRYEIENIFPSITFAL